MANKLYTATINFSVSAPNSKEATSKAEQLVNLLKYEIQGTHFDTEIHFGGVYEVSGEKGDKRDERDEH